MTNIYEKDMVFEATRKLTTKTAWSQLLTDESFFKVVMELKAEGRYKNKQIKTVLKKFETGTYELEKKPVKVTSGVSIEELREYKPSKRNKKMTSVKSIASSRLVLSFFDHFIEDMDLKTISELLYEKSRLENKIDRSRISP